MNLGDKIFEFSLKDQNNNDVKITGKEGKSILLSFHPLAFTPICNGQMEQLDKEVERLKQLNTVAYGISVDSPFAKKAWADQLKIKNLTLLSDFWPHGELAKKLGIFNEKLGVSNRANLLFNSFGKLKWIKIYDIGQLPDMKEILTAVKDVTVVTSGCADV